MHTPPGLFSRASGVSTVDKARGFLSLPPEIRNRVYEYCFQPDFYCELAASGRSFTAPTPRMVTLSSGVQPADTHVSKRSAATEDACIAIRVSRPLGKYNMIHGLQTKWPTSLHALHLVCKQLHAETLALIYRKTVFVFDAPRRLNNFLRTVSSPNLRMATRLHLHLNTYGPPKKLEHCHWQHRHTESWVRTCKAAARSLKSLHELVVWVQVNQSPLRFNLREQWVAPLLQFRRLRLPQRSVDSRTNPSPRSQQLQTLKKVTVYVGTHWSTNPLVSFNGNAELAKASEDLHLIFGQAISSAILGANEVEAMADFDTAWRITHQHWQYHLGFAQINW